MVATERERERGGGKYNTTNDIWMSFSMMLKRVIHATKCAAVMRAAVFIYPVVRGESRRAHGEWVWAGQVFSLPQAFKYWHQLTHKLFSWKSPYPHSSNWLNITFLKPNNPLKIDSCPVNSRSLAAGGEIFSTLIMQCNSLTGMKLDDIIYTQNVNKWGQKLSH